MKRLISSYSLKKVKVMKNKERQKLPPAGGDEGTVMTKR